MRAITFFAILIMGAAGLILIPAVGIGQPGGGRFGGKSGGMMSDPNKLFDFMARDRNYFLISEVRMRSMSEALTKYAQEKGITSGQITRQVFLDYQDQRTKQLAASGFPGSTGGSFKGGFPGGSKKFGGGDGGPASPGAPALNPEALNQLADLDFLKRDRNSDGKLVPEEMSSSLRSSLAKYDKNGDGMIDRNEYRAYYTARMQGAEDGASSRGAVTVVNDEEELDRKPTVYRVGGKMPPGIPAWFKELDTDNDGQVALYEWRKANKPMDDFKDWDANSDGFITPEEAAKHQMSLAAKDGKTTPGASTGIASSMAGENGGRPAFGMDRKNGKGGYPGMGKSGFGKGKKKGGGSE